MITPDQKIQKRARNSVRGRKAKAAGDKFELWIERQHDRALERGVLAHVMHNEPKTNFANGKLFKEKPSAADYTGMIDNRQGRYYAAEAKSTTESYLKIDALTKKQQAHLEAVARGDGLAFLLIEFRSDEFGGKCARYAIPWLAVPWKIKKTAISVDEEDIATWAIPANMDCYLQRYYAGGPRSSLAGGPHTRNYPVE